MTVDTMLNVFNNLDIFESFSLLNKRKSHFNPTFHRDMEQPACFKYTANIFTTMFVSSK